MMTTEQVIGLMAELIASECDYCEILYAAMAQGHITRAAAQRLYPVADERAVQIFYCAA